MHMNNNQPLITILTDTKNRAELISRCIESIQKQTYQNYEHIIADGGTDTTEKVIAAYNDSRIRYVKVPEGGPVMQTKTAFEMSKGDFITFLDDDDEYLPEKLEKQLELIQSLPKDYGFIYGTMSYYDNNTNEYLYNHEANLKGGKELLKIAVADAVICGTPTLMFRREAFTSIGGTWIAGIGNERSDMALVCKALKQGWKVAPLKESYVKIYVNHQSVRMSDTSFYKNNNERYIKFHNYFLNEYADVIADCPKAGANHYHALVIYYSMLGQIGKAFSNWIKLLKVKFTPHSFALLPYYIFKHIMHK